MPAEDTTTRAAVAPLPEDEPRVHQRDLPGWAAAVAAARARGWYQRRAFAVAGEISMPAADAAPFATEGLALHAAAFAVKFGRGYTGAERTKARRELARLKRQVVARWRRQLRAAGLCAACGGDDDACEVCGGTGRAVAP